MVQSWNHGGALGSASTRAALLLALSLLSLVLDPQHTLAGTDTTSPIATQVDAHDLRARGEAGDVEAQTAIGALILGKQIPGASESEGLGWIQRAADRGHGPAEFLIGVNFLSASPPDRAASAKWLTRSATHGCAGAAGILASSYLGDQDKAKNQAPGIRWLRYAAEHGDWMSQLLLGQAYWRGAMGLPVDKVEAFAWISVAIKEIESAPHAAAALASLESVSASLPKADMRSAQRRAASYQARYKSGSLTLCSDSFPAMPHPQIPARAETPLLDHVNPPYIVVTSTNALNDALANAKRQGKLAVVAVLADWAIAAKDMERETFRASVVEPLLKHIVLIKLDVTSNSDDVRRVLATFGVPGSPALLAFDRDGNEIRATRFLGYMPADRFVEWVNMLR